MAMAPASDYSAYLREMSKHKYIVIPVGSGIDSPQIWESLYMGSIPVLLSTPIDPLLQDLPAVIIKADTLSNADFDYNMFALSLSIALSLSLF
jgi:hypothetical protein